MPAPPPYAFKSKKELHEKLGSPQFERVFKGVFKQRWKNKDDIISFSVTASTIRGFHLRHGKPGGAKMPPLELWQEIAKKFLNSEELANWQAIETKEEMRKFVLSQAEHLREEWVKKVGRKFDPGIKITKLLNLTLKFMTCWSKISKQERERLIPLLEVPLDSYTIQGMRQLCTCAGKKIPSNASMGFVESKEQYVELQDAIRELCGTKFYPVQYEVAAWDASHRSTQ